MELHVNQQINPRKRQHFQINSLLVRRAFQAAWELWTTLGEPSLYLYPKVHIAPVNDNQKALLFQIRPVWWWKCTPFIWSAVLGKWGHQDTLSLRTKAHISTVQRRTLDSWRHISHENDTQGPWEDAAEWFFLQFINSWLLETPSFAPGHSSSK